MPPHLHAAVSRSSGHPDPRIPDRLCWAKGARGLVSRRNYTQSFAQQPVAPPDFFPHQHVLHPHPVALCRGRWVLSGNPLIREQLQIVLCSRHSDIETCRNLAPGGGTVLRQKSNDGHPGQVPERVNDRLQMSCGLRMGIPGHTCNLAVPAVCSYSNIVAGN